MWQNNPTSTTPVSILIRAIIYQGCASCSVLLAPKQVMTHIVWLFHMLPLKRRVDNEVPVVGDDRTSYRRLRYARRIFLNWCLPLATAMRRVAFGDPRMWCKFWRTLAYAKGTTSMGTPGLNLWVLCGRHELSTGKSIRETHVRPQVLYVLAVIGDKDKPAMIRVK